MSDLSVPAPTTTQVPLATPRTGRGRAKPATDRSATFVEIWLRAHTGLVFLFLFLPIVIVVIFSFNDTTRRVTDWDGFGLRWYQFVLADRAIQRFLLNSVIVGVATGIIATVIDVIAAAEIIVTHGSISSFPGGCPNTQRSTDVKFPFR